MTSLKDKSCLIAYALDIVSKEKGQAYTPHNPFVCFVFLNSGCYITTLGFRKSAEYVFWINGTFSSKLST